LYEIGRPKNWLPFILVVSSSSHIAIMKLGIFYSIFFVLSTLSRFSTGSPTASRLISHLLSNLDKLSRPVSFHFSPLNVTAGLDLLQIIDVDEKFCSQM
jgi:hypothetical protein